MCIRDSPRTHEGVLKWKYPIMLSVHFVCEGVQCVDTPIQPNGHDCGVLVLKFIEMWDGVSQFNGKALPDYTIEELQLIRQKFVCDWVLNEDNVLRDEVIQHYDLLLKK
ncbi:Ulp1 protease family [Vigna unguiculata]|uniref:Ulp1 protease family n=1 Tax=Vigna unguiculata TaxID=3917 RepID=A0A4D6MND9_VIGUN|nr:Ulp1 protease family [Vigna unguiculata]